MNQETRMIILDLQGNAFLMDKQELKDICLKLQDDADYFIRHQGKRLVVFQRKE
jgi:hypothetical protein